MLFSEEERARGNWAWGSCYMFLENSNQEKRIQLYWWPQMCLKYLLKIFILSWFRDYKVHKLAETEKPLNLSRVHRWLNWASETSKDPPEISQPQTTIQILLTTIQGLCISKLIFDTVLIPKTSKLYDDISAMGKIELYGKVIKYACAIMWKKTIKYWCKLRRYRFEQQNRRLTREGKHLCMY